MSQIMKSVIAQSTGNHEDSLSIEIAEKPIPTVANSEKEVLIKVVSSGINPSDISALLSSSSVRIPGRDFAGTVVVGPKQLLGRSVWGTGNPANIEIDGTHSEYIKMPISHIAVLPASLDIQNAGGQVLPFVTAYYSLVKRAQIQPGEGCLVVGALGQVGRAAMEICKWKGAHPIALVRGKEHALEAQKLGWVVVDAALPDLPQQILNVHQGQPLNVILNSTGNLSWSDFMKAVAKFGRVVTIGAPENFRDVTLDLLDLYRSNQTLIGIDATSLDFRTNASLLNELKPGFDSGQLKPLPTGEMSIYPLKKACDAYSAVQKGSTQRVIVQFD